MKDIDFLPSRFRERDRLRRIFVWRIAVIALLAGALFAVQMVQLATRRSVASQLALVALPYSQAAATSARLEQLQRDVQSSEQFAELYTYLEHPWPRTQLLSAVAQTLPPTLALTEVRINNQPAPAKRIGPAAARGATDTVPAAVSDLHSLRDEMDGNGTEVIMRGLAVDTGALQDYVAGFTNSPFFAAAKLVSIESIKDKGAFEGSRFELRLLVRPGYGQPGGPESTNAPRDAQRTARRSAETQ